MLGQRSEVSQLNLQLASARGLAGSEAPRIGYWQDRQLQSLSPLHRKVFLQPSLSIRSANCVAQILQPHMVFVVLADETLWDVSY